MLLINKPGSLIARRLCRNLSIATVANINENFSPNSTLFNIPEENTNDVENVFQKDDVEIQFSNETNSVNIAQWHTFDENTPTSSKKSMPPIIYFVTRVSPCNDTGHAARYLIEDKCVPVAWRTDNSVLKVLFSSTPDELADLLYDWKDHLLTYRHYFDIVEFRTCTIDAGDSHNLPNLNSDQLTTENDALKITSPVKSDNGSFLKGLEQLCLSDILSAKELCKSLATLSNTAESPSSSSWVVSPTCDRSTCISASAVVLREPQFADESTSVDRMCVINNDNYVERLSPCTFVKETVSNGSLSPVDEVSTPRSPTDQSGHDKFLSLFATDEAEPTRSYTSINSQHRDEIYYKRNSLTRPFKDRHFQNYHKNFNGLAPTGRRSRSLTSILSPTTAVSDSKNFDGNGSLDRNQRRRYRTFSNNRRTSKLDFLSSHNRWSTSTPALHAAKITTANEGEPSSSLFQFRRLSTMKTLGMLGPVVHPKPPNILIYCGRDSVQSMKVFDTLRPCVARSVNTVSRYLVYKLEHDRFIDDAPTWAKTVACLILADLKGLDEQHWEKLYDYFRYGGKLLFLCDNGLFASLRDCNSVKKRFSLLKLAFEGGRHRASLSSLSAAAGFLSSSCANKDFNKFLKKLSTKLDKTNVSLCEQTRVNDNDGRLKFFLSVLKEPNSPLIFYMQNCQERAGALFSDVGLSYFADPVSSAQLLMQIFERLSMEVLESDVSLEEIVAPTLTAGHFYFDKQTTFLTLKNQIACRGKFETASIALDFHDLGTSTEKKGSVTTATKDYLPIYISLLDTVHRQGDFDYDVYFSNSRTKVLGKSVLFVETITSTNPVCNSLLAAFPGENSFVVMSRIQTEGKGRVKNCWLSPKGCAMFTFGYTVKAESNLAKKSSYFQHLCVIAVVDALRSITGFENLDVRIKWPNDIYYGRTVKIGGMIVNCTMKNNSFEFTAGIGLNVANSRPTLCINDILPKGVEPFSCEQVMALILSKVEEFIDKFQAKGYESILPLYYKYWLHEYQELTLADTKEQVVVRGLDQYGFLQVRSRKSGKLISLQPDGNSLDMMYNLLRVKDDS